EIRRENKGRDAKRRPRGKRAGIRNRLRARAHRTPLPSILLANVQSLENKLDDLRARAKFQRDIRDCNLLCFTETWLNPAVPDHAIQPAEFFSVHRMDRTRDSGKSRGGGVCLMVNNSWCNSASVVPLARSCTPNLELLTIMCRPFYLPREFTSVIISAVYIPPQADTDTALCELHEALTQHQAQHRDAALIVAGDFNSANLKRAAPNFYQHITCPTRGDRTLDHCYTTVKDAYKAQSRPPFGKSDHAAIFLMPKYKQRLKREVPVQREVTRWTDQSVAALQDALDDADWDMFRNSSNDINVFTEAVVGFIGKLADDTALKTTIRTFPNQKPWVDKTIRDALRSRTAAYNAGLASGDMVPYKAASYNVRKAVKEAKQRYGRKLESQLQQNNTHLDTRGGNYVKMLFIDYSSAFNTIIPSTLTTKLEHLGLSSSLCQWICNFLTGRPQAVRIGGHLSASLTLSTGAPQGCVLSPLLYSLYTYDCVATTSSTTIIKFADDTVVVGLISDNNETAYLKEIRNLENWCQRNNLLLNVSKTKELIVDFSTKQERNYQTPIINESPVERVNSFKYLGVHITQDLSWSWHINTVVKKARQRLYHLRRLRDFRLPSKVLRNFYSCTIESILTGNILTWFGNSTMQDRRALQRVVRSAERTIHTELPDLHSIYSRRCWTKARKIVKDLSHPNNGLFSLMRSGKRFRSLKANTERLRRSFFPQAIRSLNQYITQY
ncbi:hypothetical protein M9458_052108, partial [Cirrhinus mrigala]